MSKTGKKYDFLILGQGLAGSILAHQLIRQGQSVLVIDNQHEHSSSVVAAGVINPITGHRLNMTEGFADFFGPARDYYQSTETELAFTCWQELEQIRLIKNRGQRDYFEQRIKQAEYQSMLTEYSGGEAFFPHTEFGAALVNQTAIVDSKRYLSAIHSELSQSGNLLAKKVDYENIEVVDKKVRINGIEASAIIFCEGHQAIKNPWLKHLPFKLSKGEVLTVQPEPHLEKMLNWGQWLAPVYNSEDSSESRSKKSSKNSSDSNIAKLGSNFEWHDLSHKPTPAVHEKLMASLHSHTNIKARVVAHEVGIRPTTRARRPFIGALSKLPSAYCFNGFGSKGCLLIPYYAQLMCEHLIHQVALPSEVSEWL